MTTASQTTNSRSEKSTSAELSNDARMARIDKLAHLMDESFTVPGTNYRVGWDTIIGLIPGVGDLASAGVSSYLIYEAKQTGASKWLLTKMIGNSQVDFVFGSIPVVGDLFDAGFKANRKNAQMLKKYLEKTQR